MTADAGALPALVDDPARVGVTVPVQVGATDWPLHDAGATRRAEAAAAATQPRPPLMERAGLAVARLTQALAPHAPAVRVWAGPGNNGGDGLVAARLLRAAGRRVLVCLLADPRKLPADAQAALQGAQQAGVVISETLLPPGASDDAHIDALLGLGATRAPDGAVAAAINAINAQGGVRLGVDIPSGLHPDTGACLGEHAARCTDTLALLTVKPGCYTGAGRDHAGRVWFDDLGVAAGPASAWLSGARVRPTREHASHKGSYGDVAVIGGAPGMVGAAWLAARAALAAGAGRVFCSLLDSGALPFDPARPELMGRDRWWLSAPAVLAATTVLCGCGGGEGVRTALPALLAHVRRLVLDADALNAIAAEPVLQKQLQARAARGWATVLTPHPLEAARLLHSDAKTVQSDRLHAAALLVERYGATVLLKGSGSVIAAPGQLPRINSTGNAALATAGTGDVLAGWTAGLWSQAQTSVTADASNASAVAGEIAAAAAGQHGQAADRWQATRHAGPLRAGDLIEAMAGPASG
jgi:hydroxyethylthiazole kinase-like uncharacterized protein yjeF